MDSRETAIQDLYARQAALRGECAVLLQHVFDANLRRLLGDLRDQHGRLAVELAAVLSAHGLGFRRLAEPDARGEADMPVAFASPALETAPEASLGRLMTAERALEAAYGTASQQTEPDSPAGSLIRRHAIALSTALQRLDLVARSAAA